MSAAPAVELVEVEKRFGEVVAVDRVTLDIAQGEFFSLLGPSGCGKTTSLRMIAGFEQPTAGTLRILGEDMASVPVHRRAANMVFQNYALFPHLSVFENVAFGLRVKRLPTDEIRQRVGEALELVRLQAMERRKPAQLSGGQQQRVALARALVNHPAVLLLDEPLGALDQKLRKDMQLELKRLQREIGITFVYVTHDQEEALTMSDRIAVMQAGRVLQVDDPVTLYDRPADRFVADFIGTSNFLDGTVTAAADGWATVDLRGVGSCKVPAPPGTRAGAGATVMIRPERITLDPGPPRRAAGVVAEMVFVGNDTLYLVELSQGATLTVRHQNRLTGREAAAHRPGDRVEVAWPDGAAVLVE